MVTLLHILRILQPGWWSHLYCAYKYYFKLTFKLTLLTPQNQLSGLVESDCMNIHHQLNSVIHLTTSLLPAMYVSDSIKVNLELHSTTSYLTYGCGHTSYCVPGCTWLYIYVIQCTWSRTRRRTRETRFWYKLPDYLTHGCTCKIGADQHPRKPDPRVNIASH